MPLAVSGINQLANNYAGDRTRPADPKVLRMEWGTAVQDPERPLSSGAPARIDPFVIVMKNLVPGGKLLFLNTSDPRATWPQDHEMAAAIAAGQVGAWDVPVKDPGTTQIVAFTDEMATKWKLVSGCRVALKQMDPAGNISAGAAQVQLGAGSRFHYDGALHTDATTFGNTALPNGAYTFRSSWSSGDRSSRYLFTRYPDATAPIVHVDGISLQHDGATGVTKFAADRAIEPGATVMFKNLVTQKVIQLQVDEFGTIAATEVELKPTEAYRIEVLDPNGVELEIANEIFNP